MQRFLVCSFESSIGNGIFTRRKPADTRIFASSLQQHPTATTTWPSTNTITLLLVLNVFQQHFLKSVLFNFMHETLIYEVIAISHNAD